LNRAAAFEEFADQNYPDTEIEHWLEAVTTFAVNHRSVRLLYFHPPGILQYRPIIRQWMSMTGGLRSSGQFRWYTMSGLATFLNSRKQVDWKVSRDDRGVKIEAKHPTTLEHQAWFFPAGRFAQPRISGGIGKVTKKDDGWMVIAGPTKALEIEAQTTGH
ncbi:MAG TPA: hypothetical protein VLK33_19410, partial [Terriglobales bacterium]|nr:hypothetical protein [Terriglobales bacterium]